MAGVKHSHQAERDESHHAERDDYIIFVPRFTPSSESPGHATIRPSAAWRSMTRSPGVVRPMALAFKTEEIHRTHAVGVVGLFPD